MFPLTPDTTPPEFWVNLGYGIGGLIMIVVGQRFYGRLPDRIRVKADLLLEKLTKRDK